MAGGKPAWLVNKIRAQASARKRASVGASVASSSNKKRSKVDDGASELPPPPPPVDPATLDRALATVSSRAPRLAAALLPFQREGVEFVLRKGGRALIAHDMGLGKTLQALAVLAHYSHEWPALVVVPASMRWPWVDALELWLDGLLRPGDVCVVRDGGCTSVAHPESKVVVVSYPLLVNPSIRAQVEAAKFRVVVADESHYLKDPKAKRTQALAPVLRRALRCVLLSGTPALNRPKDLFPQLDAIKPGGFGSFSDFARRYCDAKRLPWGWSFDGGSHLEELHRRLVDGYMHRRLKAVVADQLPPKRRERVRIELSGAAAAKMRAAHAELAKLATARRDASMAGANADANATGASSREARFEALRGLSAFGRATAEAKAADVAAHVAELVEGGTKLLFFAHHHVMLDAMENALRAARVPHVRVDGTTPSLERASAVRRFQEDSALRVAVLSIQACGQGLTLTAASDVVFGELHWVPSAMLQAEDRAHRMGQKNPVNVKYLCAAGTADDIVWPAIRRKLENLGRALDGEAATLGAEDVEGSSLTADGGVLAALMAHYAANSADASRFIAAPGGGRDFSSDDPSGGIHSRDIRAFFGAGATRRNRIRADGNDDDDENATADANVHAVVHLTAEEKDDGARWACGACTFLNPSRAEACEMCDTPPPKASASQPSPSSSPSPPSSSPPPPSSSPSPSPSPPPSPSPRADLAFEVSGNTSRVFVHRRASGDSKDEWVYAGARLTPGEFRAADTAGADEDLPEILRPAAARRAMRAFLRDWDAARPTAKPALIDRPLRPPLAPIVERERAGVGTRVGESTERFATMERFLRDPGFGGGSRPPKPVVPGDGDATIREWRGSTGRAWRQYFTADGAPLCLSCAVPYDERSRERFGHPFCAEACARRFRVLSAPGAAREALRRLERGVCRLCGLDCEALLRRLLAEPSVPERVARLEALGLFGSDARAWAVAARPRAGDLWQADHVVPVAEGGGECDLDNYRTLCERCHRGETAALRARARARRGEKDARGTADIRGFFAAGGGALSTDGDE